MITGLNHVNLRAPAAMLAELLEFYQGVLGLELGPRPNFGTHGYWLYAGGQPIVHLSEQRAHEPPRVPVNPAAASTFDHVAFSGDDAAAMTTRLATKGLSFRESRSEMTRQHQVFFQDPAGNGVEINFPY